MAKPKYLISESDFAELRKKAAQEYYQFRVLEKPKTKSMTPLAKNVHNIRLQRRAHLRFCENDHFRKAQDIANLRGRLEYFKRDATLYLADKINKAYSDIIQQQSHSSVTAFLNRIERIQTVSGCEACILDYGGWHRVSMGYSLLEDYECGKWMCFFVGDNYEWAASIVKTAVVEEICEEAKCSLPTHLNSRGRGVICLYGEDSDYDFHKRCTQFMIDHNMIQRTKNGLFHNITFKTDWMTGLGIYGTPGKIQLCNLRDLKTGEWIYDEKNINDK